MLKFGIESKRSSQLTSTDGFKRYLTIALLEMRDVCLNAIEEENRLMQSKEEQARLWFDIITETVPHLGNVPQEV